MGKRIKTLASAASIADTDVLPIDNTTITEAQKISISQLRTAILDSIRQTDSVAIVVGANTITFPAALPSAGYKVVYNAKRAGTDEQFLGETGSYLTTGFTFTSPSIGTLEYIAIL